MGFGLLFIGYVITYILRLGLGDYAFASMLIGCFLMYLGLSELRKYGPAFIYALIADILLIFCSFFECLEGIDMILSLSAADAVLSRHPAVSAFLTGLMEVTRGCKQISAVLPLPAAAVLCGTLISFGGMCVFAQSFVYLKECGVSFRQLLAVKCLQASVAAALTFAAVSVLY